MAEFDRAWRLTEHSLTEPLRWRKSVRARIGADLFDDSVSDEIIDHRFAVMALCPQHTFQVLTKRAERMLDYFNGCVAPPFDLPLQKAWVTQWWRRDAVARAMYNLAEATGFADRLGHVRQLPLPNVWLGTSVERQQEADERIPLLRETPAAVRFISFEPLLGHIEPDLHGIHWAIAGGESGPNARPMHPVWARRIRNICAAQGVAFFFKQWGEYLPVGQSLPGCGKVHGATAVKSGRMKLHYGGTPQQAPKFAFAERGVEFASTADGRLTFRVGKKAAGRLLDGKLHNEFPSQVIATKSPQSQALPESNPASASLVSSLGLNPRVATSGEEAGAGAVLKDDRK